MKVKRKKSFFNNPKASKMKNIIITTICVVLSYGMSYAQQPAVTAPSAAAFNYTQYSSSRTNYIDGSESIEVPIASVSEGPLSHGVSISYNTKGIKTNTVASQVGLGWHLNAGGMITRSIQGISDDNSNGYGYWEMNDNSYSGSDQLYVEGDRDLQPDIYHYNVGGFSGSFTLDENNNFHNIPVSNRKIEVEWDGVNGNSYDFGFVRFIITDEMGTKYYFGVDDNNNDYLEFTAVKSPSEYMLTKCCNDRDDITGWFLYKIESFDQKHSINFEYSPSDYHYLSLATQAKFKYKELNGNVMGESDHLYQGNHPSFDDVFNDVTTVSWVVSKISCSNVEIDFINRDLSQGSQYAREDVFYRKKYVCCDGNSFITDYPSYLESINVNYLGTTKCVKFELNQSYFEDLTTNNHGWPYYNANKKRLKLDGIQKMSCDNSLSEPATTFEYYGNNFFPTYLTTGVDEWGYYNAKNTNSYKLIPSASYTYQGETFHYGTADRSSHINENKTGVLKKVT